MMMMTTMTTTMTMTKNGSVDDNKEMVDRWDCDCDGDGDEGNQSRRI
jgi:hypothetical protein